MTSSQLDNPFSPARRGLSYLEVLIAAGIGLVGMLGAIALFPVATLQMQRGLEADSANAIGEAAIHQAETLDLDDARRWVFTNPNATPPVIAAFVQHPNPNNTLPEYAHASDAAGDTPSYMNYGNKSWHQSLHPLSSFCIDTRFFAQFSDPTQANGQSYWLYPYVPVTNVNATNPNEDARMWRISLWNGNLDNTGAPFPTPFSLARSRLLFKSADDLIFNREAKDSFGLLPAAQVYIANGGTNQRRDYLGEYEWMATLVPKLSGSSDPNSTQAIVQSGEYVLSIVVFHNRRARLDTIIVNAANENFVEDERVVDVVQFLGNGVGGGDVLIRTRLHASSNQHHEADTFVRENDWVMLGRMVNLFDNAGNKLANVAPVFQWYRVTGTQGEATALDQNSNPIASNAGPYFRYMTLQGGDWQVGDVNDPNLNANAGQNNPNSKTPLAQMTLVTGVVGVFERTVRLETGDLW